MKLSRNPKLAIAPSDGGYLIFDPDAQELHRLNASATVILELCDGTRTEFEILATVSTVLDDELDSCRAWIQAAIDNRWLRRHSMGLPVSDSIDASIFAKASDELCAQGAVLSAFVCQEQAVLLEPSCADYWSSLGELAHIVGRRERAREAYERYLVQRPDDAEIKQIVTALRNEAPPSRAPDKCLQQLYSRFSAFYEQNMCEDLDYQAPRRILELLDEQLGTTTNLDILDLGCGTGLSAKPLKPRARSLTGVDISPEMLKQALATGLYDELETAELTSWFSKNRQQFDMIAACDTLIYFGDLHQIAVPAASHLRPGGWLIFTVEKGAESPFKLTDSGRYAHSEAHLREVAKNAGLSIICLKEGFLRKEYGEEITGLIALMEKPN